MAKTTPHVKNLDASLTAALERALQARARVSAARQEHGLRDRQAFYTAAEVRELQREHDAEMKALVRGIANPDFARMAQFGIAPISAQTQAQIDWMATVAAAREIVAEHGRETATKATAEAIVRAGRRRRAEED